MSEFWRHFATVWLILAATIVGVFALVGTFLLAFRAVDSATRRERLRYLAGLIAALIAWTTVLALIDTWDRTSPR